MLGIVDEVLKMNYRNITSLMLRIAGLLILVQLVISFPREFISLIQWGGESVNKYELFVLLGFSLTLPAAIGVSLIYFPSIVANRIVSVGSEGESIVKFDDFRPLIISCLGLYFISTAIFDGIYLLSKLNIYFAVINKEQWMGPPPALMPDDFAGIASTSVQLLIGLVLLLGSKGISHFIEKLRA